MTTIPRRPVAQVTQKRDPFIRQQDTCTPWGLHYNAYQDTYRTPHAHPKTHRTPRKQTTAG
jgi:hypothetical protein